MWSRSRGSPGKGALRAQTTFCCACAACSAAPHLLLALAALLLFAWVTMPTLEPYTVFAFVLGWALLGAEVARCADFARVRGPQWPQILFLTIYAAIAVGLVVLLAHPANPALVVVLTVPAMLWTAIVRSRPRRITGVSVVEVGLGVVVSPEIVSFYILCSHAL